jgi:hypothetical protein
MNALYFLLGIVVIALVTALLIGWLVPLIIGIVKLRRRTGGIALTIIGVIWALGASGFAVVGYRQFGAALRVADFDPSTYHGQTGTVTLPYQGESSLIVTNNDLRTRLRLHVRGGVAQAPVGRYQLQSYFMSMKDKAGATWTANHFSSASQALVVTAASPVHLNFGPPFTARVDVSEGPAERTMLQLGITGRGGESCIITSDKRPVAPPHFEILDHTGQVVWHGSFEYG